MRTLEKVPLKEVAVPPAPMKDLTVLPEANQKIQNLNPPAKVQIKKNADGVAVIHPVGDNSAFLERLKGSLGTDDMDLAGQLMSQLVASKREVQANEMNAGIAVVHGIQPNDTLESLLTVQMNNVHNLALEFTHRVFANKEDPLLVVDSNVNHVVKLMSLFNRQLEILGKYRNRGQQNVTVQHVSVSGGQTIVGTVNRTEPAPGDGVGVSHESNESTL
jgi:hypothetical protein